MVLDIVAGIAPILEAIRVRREESKERERQWRGLQRRPRPAKARKERQEMPPAHLQRVVDLRRKARKMPTVTCSN
jgi:hypothetical protein